MGTRYKVKVWIPWEDGYVWSTVYEGFSTVKAVYKAFRARRLGGCVVINWKIGGTLKEYAIAFADEPDIIDMTVGNDETQARVWLMQRSREYRDEALCLVSREIPDWEVVPNSEFKFVDAKPKPEPESSPEPIEGIDYKIINTDPWVHECLKCGDRHYASESFYHKCTENPSPKSEMDWEYCERCRHFYNHSVYDRCPKCLKRKEDKNPDSEPKTESVQQFGVVKKSDPSSLISWIGWTREDAQAAADYNNARWGNDHVVVARTPDGEWIPVTGETPRRQGLNSA